MESVPGDPSPDLLTLWVLILIQYGAIFVLISLAFLLLWSVTWYRKRKQSSSVPSSHANDPDLWFREWEQGEYYRDFSNN